MKRIIAVLSVYTAVFFGVAASDAHAQIKLSLGSIVNDTHEIHETAKMFADKVAEKTKGEVQIQLFFGGKLGNSPGMIRGLKSGTVDMVLDWTNVWGPFIPEFDITSLPFLLNSREGITKAYQGEAGTLLAKAMLENNNVRLLAWLDYGYHHVFATQRIEKLEDMRRLNVRVPAAEVVVEQYKAVGSKPIVVPLPEVYTALRSGVINALDVSYGGFLSGKYYEVAKFGAATSQFQLQAFLAISNTAFSRLSEAQKEAIAAAAQETKVWHDKTIWAKEDELKKKIAALITLDEPNLAPFQEATKAMHEDYKNRSPKHRAVYEAFQRANAK